VTAAPDAATRSVTPATPVGRLGTVVLDCDEPAQLAAFWSALLGREIVEQTDEWWELAPLDGGVAVAFQRVGKHRPPNARRPQQLHLDVDVADLDAAERAALALGAVPLGETHPGGGKPWRVYTDPAGHPFCLCTC
jgi:catechol 2,3-dioxygenase-like lactoylglutathione lyase family enzyme